jgi:Bardet-Biedl syndrome 5 protein
MASQKSLRVRESKFGRALVLETFAKAGGYILGFRVDPQDRINEVYQEVHSLYQIYSVTPMFGVDFTLEAEAPNLEQLLQPKVNEDTELIDDHEDTHAIAVSDRTPTSDSICALVCFLSLVQAVLAASACLRQRWARMTCCLPTVL